MTLHSILYHQRKARAASQNGFSLLEVFVAVAIIGVIAGLAVVALRVEKEVDYSKLQNDVGVINRSIRAFQANGGKIAVSSDANDILSSLKSSATAEQRETHVGLRGAMIDRRLVAIPLSAEEVNSSVPRAIWKSSLGRFDVVTSGPGIKEFVLKEEAPTATIERTSSVKYASVSNWVWDYNETSEAIIRPEFSDEVFLRNTEPTVAVGGTGPSSLFNQLNPPSFSLDTGFYDISLYPLRVSLNNPNPAGTSEVMYSLDDGVSWTTYTGNSVTVHPQSPTAGLIAYCRSLDPDVWQDSVATNAEYETFTFSGTLEGSFKNPSTADGDTAVYSIEETPDGGSLFTWGDPSDPGASPSSLTFRGSSFSDIVPEQSFVVGTIDFYNGTIVSGTGASGVDLDIELSIEVNVPILGKEFSFPLELINTPNYDWQTEDENADYVKLSSNSALFATTSDGTEFYLILEFTDSTASGFTTIDEFHVWEGASASGTLTARVTTTPPGSEDTLRPSAVLYVEEVLTNGPFSVTASFDEYVHSLELSDFIVENGVASSLQGDGFEFLLYVTPDSDGDVTVLLPENMALDQNDNGNTESNLIAVEADLTSPGVQFVLSGEFAAGTGTSQDPFRINGESPVILEFTESVTGLTLADLIPSGSSQVSNLSGTAETYSFTVDPMGDSEFTLSLLSGAVRDLVGNTISNNVVAHFLVDTDAPTINLATENLLVSSAFDVTATCSEAVSGFSAEDVAVSNGTVSAFSGSGADYTFTILPQSLGDISVSVPGGAFVDLIGNSNLASNTLTVTYTPPPNIDFNDYTISSYDPDQDAGEFLILADGATIKVEKNAWKAIDYAYHVTERTVLEFDFKSDKLGEIHGIGFDSDSSISSNRLFRIYGSQNWGISSYATYDNVPAWHSYKIPVGEFYTGDFTKLFFAADDDARSDGNSYFRNVRIYEE